MRILAVAALVAATLAHADDEPPQFDVTYVIGELHDTTATLSARYVVPVHGWTFELAQRVTDIPVGAVATSVVVHAPDGTHRLELRQATKAREAFMNLNGPGNGPSRRWSVLVEVRGTLLELSIAAPRAARLVVDVEYQMPTCFWRDARYVQVPVTWKRALSPALRPRTGPQVAGCHELDAIDPDELWVAFPTAELAHRAAGSDRIGASASRVDVGDAHVARLELALATQLGDVPDDLATALVVDSSRSMTGAQLEAQRELVQAYARAAGDSRVQVIAYARTARALLPSWTIARAAAVRLDRELRALAPRNGSNIDVGLAEAGRWLAQTTGTKRVVLVTDAFAARRISGSLAAFAKLLPEGTLVHVVTVDEASALGRFDGGFGAPLAEATGGITALAGVPDDEHPLDATMLVRPIAIDELEITAPGWKRFSQLLASSCGNQLAEGRSCVWFGEGDAVAGPIAAEGMIWGRRFSRVLRPDPARGVELARELTTMSVLDTRSLEHVQRVARAASTGWSFYGEWGPRGGYDAGGFGFTGGSGSFTSRSTSAPRVTIGRPAKLPSLDLAPQLSNVASRCALGDLHVEAEVETTLSEIVDVLVIAPPEVVTCVEDAIWDTAITIFPPVAHARSRVVLNH